MPGLRLPCGAALLQERETKLAAHLKERLALQASLGKEAFEAVRRQGGLLVLLRIPSASLLLMSPVLQIHTFSCKSPFWCCSLAGLELPLPLLTHASAPV